MSYGLEVLNRIDVVGNPVNFIDPWGLVETVCNITGEWVDPLKILDINAEYTGNTWGFGAKLWPPSISQGHINFLVNGTAHLKIRCKKECLCMDNNDEWMIDKNLSLPTIPVSFPMPLWSPKGAWLMTAQALSEKARKAVAKAREYYLDEIASLATDADIWCKASAQLQGK